MTNNLKRKGIQMIQNHIVCIGCTESYITRLPKNLMCGHVLCERCCEKSKIELIITCPTCKVRTKLNSDNVNELPTNYPLKNIALHIEGEDQKKKKFVKCKEHSKSCKIFYQTCMELICTVCAILGHTNHKNTTIEKAADNLRLTLKEDLEGAKIVLTKIVSSIKTTRALISKASAKKSSAEKEIKSSLDKLRTFIDHKESELLGNANSQISATLTHLNRMNIHLKEVFNKTQNLIQNIEQAISHKENSSDLLVNFQTFVEQLKEIGEIEEIEVENTDDIQITTNIKEVNHQNPPVLFFKGLEDIEIQQLVNTAINKLISNKLVQKDYTQMKVSRVLGPTVGFGEKTYQFKGLSFVTLIPSNCFEKVTTIKSDVLVVTDTLAHKIILLDKESGALHLVIDVTHWKNLKSPRGVCAIFSSAVPHVKILVCCTNSLQLYDIKQGDFLDEFTNENLSAPHAVECIPHSKNLVVTNVGNNLVTIHKGFSESDDDKNWGQILKILGKPTLINFESPTGLAINNKGNLIITSYHGSRVYILDNYKNDFKVLKTFGAPGLGDGKFVCPFGVTVDCCDNILVANHSAHNIQIFNENGTWVQSFGKSKNEGGELLYPLGIFVDHVTGDVFVVDENNTLQIF